ncbi:tachykinin-like peptides receptor 86C [Stylophora pistillata]|uniref:tachykinin-like peptides receptor 86C n=1 Tax=Stylophora pistillata TaxID=50429 RepID=UPI000C03D07F|nr:tachykinin-like peptides receptor 86C [Stylophora pistillata]
MNESNINASLLITTHDIVFGTLYSFIVFFGVITNGIIVSIVRKTRTMHTTTNYLLMNLAVADFLTLLFCPGFYDFSLHNFRLGSETLDDIFCKFIAGNAIVCVSFDASVLTLCAIAVERYLGIVKPFNKRWVLTKKKVNFIIVVIWVTAAFSSLPDMLWTKKNNEDVLSPWRYPCTRPWTVRNQKLNVKAYILSHSVALIVLPSVLLCFCYISSSAALKSSAGEPDEDPASKRNMKRLLKLLISVALAFCTLCLPFAVFFFYVTTLAPNHLEQSFKTLFLTHRIVRFLKFSNSFVNPLLYAAQSKNYREVLFQKLCPKNNTRNTANDAAVRAREEKHRIYYETAV